MDYLSIENPSYFIWKKGVNTVYTFLSCCNFVLVLRGIYLYTYEKLISWVENIKEKNHSSAAALCIIKDNKIVLEHYSGYHSNISTSKKVTASSQFNVTSARK